MPRGMDAGCVRKPYPALNEKMGLGKAWHIGYEDWPTQCEVLFPPEFWEKVPDVV